MSEVAEAARSWAAERHFQVWFEPETTSTNAIAKESNLTSPKLFLTESQTAGRGRGTHTWTTPRGALLSTWAFPLSYAPQPILSPLIGLVLFDACNRAFPDVAFNLKAPNDLFVGDKKIAGLLIENVMMGSTVTCLIGLGFNAVEAPAGVDTSTGLVSHASTANWPAFFDAWYDGLLDALTSARHPELSETARERLCAALNLHPLLKENILNVGPAGQIQTPTQTLDWLSL